MERQKNTQENLENRRNKINIEWNYKRTRYSELAEAFEVFGIDDIVDDQKFIDTDGEVFEEK